MTSSIRNKLTVFIIILLLAVLTLLFFRKVIFFRGDYIIQGSDLIQTYYQKFIYKEALLKLKLPLWNPYIYSGYPFLAHPYNGTFYPPNLLFLTMPINVAYSWILALHVFLAGIFMFLLSKYLVKDNWAALVSALAFMFGGFTATRIWAGHFELFTTSIWIPLALLAFLITLDRKSFLFSILTGAILTIQFFAGHNQTFFFSILILLAYCVFSFFQKGAFKDIPVNILLFISTIFFFAVFSAVQLLPAMELTRLSTRSAGVPFFKSAYGSFPPDQLIRFVIPDFFGDILKTGYPGDPILGEIHWEFTYYIGIIPLIMAINSIRIGLNSRTKRILLLVGAFIFIISILTRVIFLQLWAARNHPAIARPGLIQVVNFFEMVYNGKLSMWTILPFFLLLFIGLLLIFLRLKRRFIDPVVRSKAENDRTVLFLAVSAILGLVLAFGHFSGGLYYFLYKFFPAYNKFKWPSRHLIISNFALCVLAGYGMARLNKRYYLKILLILLALVDLFWYGHKFIYLRNLAEFYPPKTVVDKIQDSREIGRITTFPALKSGCVYEPSCSEFQSNAGIPLGIFNVTGYDPIILRRYHELTNVLQNLPREEFGDVAVRFRDLSNVNLLKLLNVKYIFTERNFDRYKLDRSKFEIVEKSENGYLLLFKNYLPRFRLVNNAVVAFSEKDLIDKIGSPDFSPEENVVLEAWQSPVISNDKVVSESNPKIEVKKYLPDEITLEVNTPVKGYLMASEVYYPGWEAYVNGGEFKIYRANYALRAVYIPAPGRYVVQFKFEPQSLQIGKWITIFGLVFSGFYFFLRQIPTRRMCENFRRKFSHTRRDNLHL